MRRGHEIEVLSSCAFISTLSRHVILILCPPPPPVIFIIYDSYLTSAPIIIFHSPSLTYVSLALAEPRKRNSTVGPAGVPRVHPCM